MIELMPLAAWLERHAGLAPDATRAAGLSGFVAERLALHGLPDEAAYCALLDRDAAERAVLLDRVTIQETHFHRNRPQVEALRRHVLPDVLLRAARQRRPAVIWSAGCSTGEEPYTVAMLVAELVAAMDDPPEVRILGTDVSPAAIGKASAGVYSGRTVQLAEDGALARWFDPVPDAPGEYTVRDEVRRFTRFAVHNLLTPPPLPAADVDLVLCRNVTIYFSRETTRGVIARFASALRPDGWLLVGHSETLWQLSSDFDLIPLGEAFGYRRAPVAPEPLRPTLPPPPRPGAASRVTRTLGPSAPRRAPGRPPARTPASAAGASPAGGSVDSTSADLTAAAGRESVTTEQVAASFLASARQAMAAGRYADALESAERAVVTDPLLTDGYVLIGYLLSTLGRDAEATAALRKAMFLSPGSGHVHFLLGAAQRRLGDRVGALRAFRTAAETLPLTPPEDVEPLLDGRPLSDLITLCRDLAEGD